MPTNILTNNNKTLMLSECKQGVMTTNLTPWMPTFSDFAKRVSNGEVGQKDGSYYIRGQANKRSDTELNTGYVVILDGDKSIDLSTGVLTDGAPDAEQVHQALKRLDIPHVLYTTHSHRDDYPRYRVVIPIFDGFTREQLKPCVTWLINKLHDEGVLLADVPENSKWSNAWYFPRKNDINCPFQAYHHFGNEDVLTRSMTVNIQSPIVKISNANSKTEKQPRLADKAKIKAALRHITSSSYDDWIKIGMAISYELGDDGFYLFHEWSRNQPSYQDEQDCQNSYNGFSHGSNTPVTMGTLLHLATEKGWDKSIPNDDYVDVLLDANTEQDLAIRLASIVLDMGLIQNRQNDIIDSILLRKQ